MLKKLWNVWYLTRNNLLLVLAAMLAGMLFGTGLVAVIVFGVHADSYAVLGSFMAFIIWIGVILFSGGLTLGHRFSVAVAMGETRKSYILNEWLVLFINTLIEVLVLVVMNAAERAFDSLIYTVPCELDVLGMLDYRMVLIAVFLVPSLSMFLGMLLVKFQMKAFWALWVLWMLVSLGGSRLGAFVVHNPDSILAGLAGGVMAFFADFGLTGVVWVVLAVSVLLTAIAAGVLRREPVTQV